MADRREVQPHHVLRAVLDDRFTRDVVTELGAEPDQVRVSLEVHFLALAEVDLEQVSALGVDVATLLGVLNPTYDARAGAAPADWNGRVLSPATRDVMVRALRERVLVPHRQAHGGHLLLALLGSRDPVVAATLRDHDLRLRPARALVRRWGRRAP